MKIPHIVFSILFLVSCSNPAHYAALQQADSLMNESLDSAYTSLRMIDPNQLSKEDEAYYSLLQTTVQYKKCIPIPNDSIINIAIEYYTNHFDQNKLTRALMYKGAVLAELKYNTLALECYKEAEMVADSTDLMTMGLLNYRLGELYQKSYIKNEEHIKRYKQSLNYFKKANHSVFENQAKSAVGQQYITTNKDSAYLYLTQSLELAKQRRDKQEYSHCCFVLSEFYDYPNINLQKAKNFALVVYQSRDSIRVGSDLYSHLSILYCKLGQIDSARYFAKQISEPYTSIDSMRYYMMQEEIALAENDYKTAFNSYKISEKIADSLVKLGKSEEYYSIDKQFDNQVIKTQKAQLEIANNIKTFIIISAIIGLILMIVMWRFYAKRKRRILIEKEQFIDNLQSNLQHILSTHIKQLNQSKGNETTLKRIIENRIEIEKKLLNIKHQYGSNANIFFNKFNEILVLNQKSQEDYDDIINVANSLYSNVISHIEQSHSNIKNKEKLLLSMVCLKFTPVEMLVFLNLNNLGSVYNLRSNLLKKLETSSLEDYLNEQIKHQNQDSQL